MPIHDWTKVPAGIFHDFHHEWISAIKHALNRGLLGPDYYAMAEQLAGGYGPDVLTLQHPDSKPPRRKSRSQPRPQNGSVAVQMPPPKTRFHITDEPKWYANKKKSVVVRHVSGHNVVAVLEIVSAGNKDSKTALEAFVRKARDLITGGIHLVLIDLFPPTARDPEGIHPLVWGEDDTTFKFDRRKPLTCVSYVGGVGAQAFVEPVAVGDKLPDMPIFLTPTQYVEAPLEATYERALDAMPEYWRDVMKDD